MDFLQLTTSTAPTARTCLPEWSPLPTAHLSPGQLSSALAEAQEHCAALIDDTTSAARTHAASLADFADHASRLDRDLATRLGGGL